jgi:DNA-directed RNA polymerase specialized sigma24 family protein
MTTSVLDRLDAEWRALARLEIPPAWTDVAPSFDGFRRVGGVVDACRSRADPLDANRVLGGLLSVAATGDRIAARTALQALLPIVATTAAGLRGYVGWGPWATRTELDAEAAATMVELIDAPRPPTPWPAAVLRSRLRDRLRTTVRRHKRQQHREGAAVDPTAHPVTALHDAHSAEERVARVIVDAAREGALTVSAAQTVLATTVYGWDTSGFARLTGRDARAVRAHRRRTERRLAALVAI